ncbi:MAG: hypothetical protein JO340_07170 [Acidobacteriaceae bacterium]|nr:hypothetical protein [Acidobacteriaceae bacterium]
METQLGIALERLRAMERLLISATPEAIDQAEALLQEAAGAVLEYRAALEKGGAPSEEAEVGEFRKACNRVMKLLEGARRAQWVRLRLLTSLTQTYTARAEAKNWSPWRGTVNVRM